jgi:hypothetical protein
MMALALAPAAQGAPLTVDRFVGGNTGTLGGEFFQPRGVGIYEATGDVYVAEGNHRIARYSSDGVFERAWGRDVVAGGGTGFEICTVAADCKAGVNGALGGEMNVPVGLAVDQSDGSVYVHDLGNRRVQRFDADGNFVLTFGKGVNQTAGGDICTATSGDVCKIGTTGAAAAQFGNNSTSSSTARSYLAIHPGTDDVFIGDPANRRVAQYESDGDFVRAWGFGVDSGAAAFEVCSIASTCQSGLTTAGAENGRFNNGGALHLAVDVDGVVYVSDTNSVSGSADDRVLRFDSDGFAAPPAALLPEITAGQLGDAAVTTGMAVKGGTGNLLVVRDPGSAEALVREIDPTDASLVETHATGAGLATVQGVAFDATRERLVLTYAATPPGQGFFVLDANGPTTPTMNIEPPLDVSATAATLRGTIDPDGFAEYQFEYSLDGVTWTPAGTGPTGVAGTSPIPVTQAVTQLQPNTTYRVRMTSTTIIGGGANGVPPQISSVSPQSTFLTAAVPPSVETFGATSTGVTTATLQGRVNPNGSVTTYWFEYGESVGYGLRAPMPAAVAGAGGADVLLTEDLAGLEAATTYHYRLCASNPFGTVCGSDASFATRTAEDGDERAYEKVSPASVAGVGVGAWYNGPAALAAGGTGAYEGDRFAPMTSLGPMLVDGGMAWAQDIALSERAPGGWVSRPAMTLPAYGDPSYRMLGKVAATPDLGRFAIASNGPMLKMFPEMADWSLVNPPFVGDWQGNWELIGPTAPTQVESGTTGNNVTMPLRMSGDGSLFLGMGPFRGLAGSDDPVLDQVAGSGSYLVDYDSDLTNTFAGSLNRQRTPLGVCAGGTLLPRVDDNGTAPGPPGSFSLFASYPNGSTTITLDFFFGGTAPQVGHTVSGPGIQPGTKVTATDASPPATGWSFTISAPTTAAGAFANISGGQDTAALADDTIAADSCPAPVAGERQRLTVQATGGTFTVSYDGQTTSPLAFNVAPTGAGSLQAALESLSSLAPGDVVVTGAPNAGRYVIRFAAALGDVPALSADASSLGGGTATITAWGSEPRSATLISEFGAALDGGAGTGIVSHAGRNGISKDGSRVFFMSPDPSVPVSAGVPNAGCTGGGATTICPPQLYVRQRNTDGSVSTRWISRAEDSLFGSQSPTLAGPAIFEGATPDGSAVFFRTNSPLTADDPNGTGSSPATTGTPSASSWDLYMYQLPGGPDGNPATPDGDPGGGELTRITRGPSDDADANGINGQALVHGIMRFAADDAGRIYFATPGEIPGVGGSSNGTVTSPDGDPATTDQVNLYLYEDNGSEESWSFVARLPSSTGTALATCASTGNTSQASILAPGPGSSTTVPDSGANCVRSSRDGSFIAFWTDGRLTADDPDAATGDMYGYDAHLDELSRISRPQGGDAHPYTCIATPGLGQPNGAQCYGDGGIETGWMPYLNVGTDSSGDHSVFFHSRSRLVPEDSGDGYDVYEWRNGHLNLVTSGEGATDGALYMGNSADGQNVYFATRDRYTWQDSDAVGDIYTARIGGGIPEPPLPPSCAVLAGSCHGPGMGVSASTNTETDKPGGGGDASPGARKTLRVGKPSTKALRSAARTGNLVVSVRTSEAGRVSAVAKGRIGKRTRRVARKSVQVREAGRARLRLRLNRAARQRLKSGRSLRLSIQVRSPGARSRSITVRLPGGKS